MRVLNGGKKLPSSGVVVVSWAVRSERVASRHSGEANNGEVLPGSGVRDQEASRGDVAGDRHHGW